MKKSTKRRKKLAKEIQPENSSSEFYEITTLSTNSKIPTMKIFLDFFRFFSFIFSGKKAYNICPYPCPEPKCGYTTTHMGNLRRHANTNHDFSEKQNGILEDGNKRRRTEEPNDENRRSSLQEILN